IGGQQDGKRNTGGEAGALGNGVVPVAGERFEQSGLLPGERDPSLAVPEYWFKRLTDVAPGPSPAFAPVHCGGGSGVRLRLPSGLAVEVGADFDPAVLVRLLQAVASQRLAWSVFTPYCILPTSMTPL
ncbi:MAG: hypothetical protein GXP31_07790, partial [Kiritimatiellaeota bacterium]|nr:hypothetical protein [Kiritimatiellota bacterium]